MATRSEMLEAGGETDRNIFGGSFTPFRDIWNHVAAEWGITTKRMRENALEQAAEEERLQRETSEELMGSIETAFGQAQSPEDVSQLRTLRMQAGIAQRMQQSADPKVREAGLQLLGNVFAEQRAFEERQEVQRIAADTRREELRSSMSATAWSRLNEVSDDLQRESGDYLAQRAAWGRVNAAFASAPTAGSDLSLIFQYMKLLDPGSVVREGEFATAQNASGVPNLVLTAYNRLMRDGERLTLEQRRDFYQQARQLYEGASVEQRERNSRYLERARAGGVPEELLGSLQIPVELPGPRPELEGGGSGGAAGAGAARRVTRGVYEEDGRTVLVGDELPDPGPVDSLLARVPTRRGPAGGVLARAASQIKQATGRSYSTDELEALPDGRIRTAGGEFFIPSEDDQEILRQDVMRQNLSGRGPWRGLVERRQSNAD